MKTKEFFEKCGLIPTKFEGGLLAIPNETLTIDQFCNIQNIPRCGAEYNFALLTCFCEDERQLMACLSTAGLIANYMQSERDIAGCI